MQPALPLIFKHQKPKCLDTNGNQILVILGQLPIPVGLLLKTRNEPCELQLVTFFIASSFQKVLDGIHRLLDELGGISQEIKCILVQMLAQSL